MPELRAVGVLSPKPLARESGTKPTLINFYKNLVMTGGFLYVIAYGAGSV